MSVHHVALKKVSNRQWNAGFIFAAAHDAGVSYDGFHYGYDSPEDKKAHKVSDVAKISCDDASWKNFNDTVSWRYHDDREVEILD